MSGKVVFDNPSPDVLEKKSGGGCLRLFGLPFFLAGLFVLQIPLGLIPLENQDEIKGWMTVFIPLFSLPFIAVGGGLLFGGKTLTMDKTRNSLTQAWKLLSFPVRAKEFPLDGFSAIAVRKDVGDSDSPTTYPVSLANKDRVPILTLVNPVKYEDSRRVSEQVAKFLNLPVEDSVSGETVVREPERLDESIAGRARRTGEKVGLPPAPPVMRSKVEQLGRQLVIDIPGRGMGAASLIGAAVPLVIAAFIISSVLDSRGPFIDQYRLHVIGLIALSAILMGLLPALRRRSNVTRVTASPEELRVEFRAGRKVKTQVIPSAELEELHLPKVKYPFGPQMKNLADAGQAAGYTGAPRMPDGRPAPKWLVLLGSLARSPGITAQSDKAMVQFGAGLPEDELEYLCALIKKAMVEQYFGPRRSGVGFI